VLVCVSLCVRAQSFEVASIKPADPSAYGSSARSTPGQFVMENMSLKEWMEIAFDVKDFSLAGPPWLDSARFNVTARAPEPAAKWAVTQAMLRNLLVERFKMAFHREPKMLPAYVLVVDKKGLKLTPSTATEGNSNTSEGRVVRITATHVTLADLADMLSQQLRGPVKDSTGLTGYYNVKLQYAPYDAAASESARSKEDNPASSVFAALQEQAGLKLETRKTQVDILVIDYIERQPSEN
jgi:uncharacterized protein (TIGR03435 family)